MQVCGFSPPHWKGVRLRAHGDRHLVLGPRHGCLVSCICILCVTGVFLEQRVAVKAWTYCAILIGSFLVPTFYLHYFTKGGRPFVMLSLFLVTCYSLSLYPTLVSFWDSWHIVFICLFRYFLSLPSPLEYMFHEDSSLFCSLLYISYILRSSHYSVVLSIPL